MPKIYQTIGELPIITRKECPWDATQTPILGGALSRLAIERLESLEAHLIPSTSEPVQGERVA